MLFFRHSKYRRELLIIAGFATIIGVALLMFMVGKQDSDTKTQWATYSVNVPAFTADSRGDHFSFQYPKSEFIELKPDTLGRLLRFQNYDPNVFSRELDGKYSLEFFIDTEGHISCMENVANAETVTNSQGVKMKKGQARQSEESGAGAIGMAACIERQEYVLYIQGSDHTGKGIVEHMIDSIHYQD